MKFRFIPLLFLLISCGAGSSSDSDSGDDRSITSPPNSLISCTKALNTNVCNFEHNGLERSFYIHAPSNIGQQEKIPLLFDCILYTSDADDEG